MTDFLFYLNINMVKTLKWVFYSSVSLLLPTAQRTRQKRFWLVSAAASSLSLEDTGTLSLMRPRWESDMVTNLTLNIKSWPPRCMSLHVDCDLFPHSGPGVQDAARRPSPEADGCSGPSTPLGDAQRPAPQIHPEQTGCPTSGQGDTHTHTRISTIM